MNEWVNVLYDGWMNELLDWIVGDLIDWKMHEGPNKNEW